MVTNRYSTMRRMIAAFTSVVMCAGMCYGLFSYSYAASVKKPAGVKWTSIKRSGTKVTLKWKKAKNAKKYQVYQKTGSGSWKLKKTLKKLTLTVKYTYGKAYSFKVRGVNGKKKGKFSAVKKIVIPGKDDKPKEQEDPEDSIDGEIAILEEPEMQIAKDGERVTFSIKAEGNNLRYQWYVANSDSNTAGKKIAAANGTDLTLTAGASNSGTYYYCVISNSTESRKTKPVLLDVVLGNHVHITEQPGPQTVTEGNNAVFGVLARGTGDIRYQWYKRDIESGKDKKLVGEDKEKLIIDARLTDDDTMYYCKVRDEISVITSDAVRLDVLVSPERTAVVESIESLIEKSGVLSDETVTIDGTEFYVLAKEGSKALIFAKKTFHYFEKYQNTTGTYVAHFFSGSGSWGYDETTPGSAKNSINHEYLEERPTLKLIALDSTILTPGKRNNAEYYETTNKVFLLTEADITGSYSENTLPCDFTFDQTEEHIGRALPKAIIKGDEDNIDHWVRTPWDDGDPKYPTPAYIRVDGDGNVEVRPRQYQEFIDIGARPAMWVDLSIK